VVTVLWVVASDPEPTEHSDLGDQLNLEER